MNMINFEWPTQDVLEKMPPDMQLRSMEFASDVNMTNNAIAAVRCGFSNRMYSPKFETKSYNPAKTKTILFSSLRPVRKIQVQDNNSSSILKMVFFDSNNQEIGNYNANSQKHRMGRSEILQENEELIGVYGVKDQNVYLCFSSFGFIVKVRELDQEQ